MSYKEQTGFIGLGVMGTPMALHLARSGVPLVVWNRSPEKCAPLQTAGAKVADSTDEVFLVAKVVILMLTDEAAIDAVLDRGTSAFSRNVADRTIVQMGTTSPTYSEALEAEVRNSRGRYVEAAVSGSRKVAEAGQLVVMLAGEKFVAEEIRSLLEPMCHDAVYCGDVPNVLLMKLASNAFLIPMITALAEAVHFANQHGLDMQKFLSVLNGGQMASNISRIKAQKLIARDLDVQAAVSDALKNNRLASEAAHGAGVATPLLDLCLELYGEAQAMGLGQDDMVAVLRAIEARTKGAMRRA